MVTLLALTGCVQKKHVASGAAPSLTSAGPAPTVAECEAFGRRYAAALTAHDRRVLEDCLRIKEWVRRSVSDMAMSSKARHAFENSAGNPAQFFDRFAGARAKFLRVRHVDGKPRVVIRVYYEENKQWTYQECPLVRYPDGKVAAEDLLIVENGEMVTATLRRFALLLLATMDQVPLDRLRVGEPDLIKATKTITQMNAEAKQGNHQAALAAYGQLPASLRKDKTFLLLAMQSAVEVGEEPFGTLLDTFRKTYPDDPAVDHGMLTYCFLKKDYHGARESLDRIIASLGDDAWLRSQRASTFIETNRLTEAKTELDKAITMEPDLNIPYWWYVTIALKEQNHAEAVTWIKKAVEQCNSQLDDEYFKKYPDYSEFVKTKEYAEVMRWYEKRDKKE
jgi:hypothetical protein